MSDNNKDKPVICNSFWSIIILLTIIAVGYYNVKMGLGILLFMFAVLFIYLECQINKSYKKNIEN
jgi:hypothetical protein